MDTGLDTTFFRNRFQGLLWYPPSNKLNLRNFLFYENHLDYDYYLDDDSHKHGTAVTALAIESIERFYESLHKLPRVMVLKVLNNKREGTTFGLSCGLSYAAQNKATVVNASLGYYGNIKSKDSVLMKYIIDCQTAGLFRFL
jgi:hypothetical protein